VIDFLKLHCREILRLVRDQRNRGSWRRVACHRKTNEQPHADWMRGARGLEGWRTEIGRHVPHGFRGGKDGGAALLSPCRELVADRRNGMDWLVGEIRSPRKWGT
jgi:hypothetical protein